MQLELFSLPEQSDLFIEARRAYARRRMSLAVDRQITSSGEAKARAGRWVLAWAKVAGGAFQCERCTTDYTQVTYTQ